MTTVLYVHGLESGPRGHKARTLEAAGFTVASVQMPCNRDAVLKDPAVWLALLAGAGLVAALAAWRGSIGFLCGVVLVFLFQRSARRALMRRMFHRCVRLQEQQLTTGSIDVVMGSSFGGAVALELLRRGAWKGPTVLLCPAHELVASRAWLDVPTLPSDATQVLVVHGRQDETVPLSHSRALVKGSASRLLEVDDDHRLTKSATPENFRAWLADVSRG